jgi:hypothetical protein
MAWLLKETQSSYNSVRLKMRSTKSCAAMGLLLLLSLFLPGGCKKTPTTTIIDVPGQDAIGVTMTPSSAGPDTIITVSAAIKGNSEEIRVFGLEMTFDTKMLQFQEVGKGSLNGGWAAVDANEISPGQLRVGGFAGGGTSIAKNSTGTLVNLKFKVTGQAYGNGQQSQVCIAKYSDDISALKPDPACAAFTLKK